MNVVSVYGASHIADAPYGQICRIGVFFHRRDDRCARAGALDLDQGALAQATSSRLVGIRGPLDGRPRDAQVNVTRARLLSF